MSPIHRHPMEDPEKQRARLTDPKYRPGGFKRRARRAYQSSWELKDTGRPAVHPQGFVYMDRVGPDMFSGRYDHGKCSTVPDEALKHSMSMEHESPEEVPQVAARNHAYMLTVTPDGAESVCLYCGSSMEGCPAAGVRLDRIPWDEPFGKPRRASDREMRAMGISPIEDDRLLYFDKIEGPSYAGRFRSGKCPEGGPHEAIIHWTVGKTPMFSVCVFCGEQWNGPPPEFWDAALGPGRPTVEGVLERYEADVRAGLV